MWLAIKGGNEECDWILRWSDIKGEEFCLNWLSRILAISGLRRPRPRLVEERAQRSLTGVWSRVQSVSRLKFLWLYTWVQVLENKRILQEILVILLMSGVNLFFVWRIKGSTIAIKLPSGDNNFFKTNHAYLLAILKNLIQLCMYITYKESDITLCIKNFVTIYLGSIYFCCF